MKRSFIPAIALMLTLFAALAFTGCEGISPTDAAAEAAGLTANRSAAAEPVAVTVSGLVVAINGKTAVAWGGIPYYVDGVDLTEGAEITVTGIAVPILDRDDEGNSLFYGYYLQAEKIFLD